MARMKEAAGGTGQRAGGRCEPAGDFCFSAFGAGGEEPRGRAPYSAEKGAGALTQGVCKLGGTAESFRPMERKMGRELFSFARPGTI